MNLLCCVVCISQTAKDGAIKDRYLSLLPSCGTSLMPMSAITRDRFLDIFPVFQRGPQALVNNILSFSQYMSAPPNIILQREGEYSPGLVLVLSGEKRIYKQSGTGKEITLYNVVAGEFCIINAMSLLSNSPYPANAISITEVELLICRSPLLSTGLLVGYKESG